MLWHDVVIRFGKEMADAMAHSQYLQGITVSLKDGEIDYPESDVWLAFKDVMGERIHPFEID